MKIKDRFLAQISEVFENFTFNYFSPHEKYHRMTVFVNDSHLDNNTLQKLFNIGSFTLDRHSGEYKITYIFKYDN